MNSFLDIDTYLAFGLVGIAIVVFLISQMGILPKKSLLFVVAALAGVLGITLFRKRRVNSLLKDLKSREDQLKKREGELTELKERYGASEQKLQEVKAELERQRAAYEKTIMQIKAENKKEKERIDNLSGDELHREFLSALDNL